MYATLLLTRCPIYYSYLDIQFAHASILLSFAATLALSDPSQPPNFGQEVSPLFLDVSSQRPTASAFDEAFATPYRIRVDEAHEDTT